MHKIWKKTIKYGGMGTDGAVAERNLPQTIGREEYGILQITHN